MKTHKIISVEEGSIAAQLGIEAGDELLTIDGQEIIDIFDYRMLERQEELNVLISKPSENDEWEYDIEKDADEELGLVFESSMMDKYRSCKNGCIFCFIDQMPRGMRKTLYFKDDDARLSFLQGNYITLTNMTDAEIDRILKYHLSPINISFHTTDPELRVKMLKNKGAGEALEKAKRLVGADTGIILNGQIVLCKGYNDGENLERTMRDLYTDYAPNLVSVSVVPVGLTKHRQRLTELKPFTRADAKKVISQIESFQKKAREERGTGFIYASDEWYLLAENDRISALKDDFLQEPKDFNFLDKIIPPEEAYDGYPQIENGVGMLRSFITEVRAAFAEIKKDKKLLKRLHTYEGDISFVTGELAYPVIKMLLIEARDIAPKLNARLYPIRNDFFGEQITVAGLLTGKDIIAQLKDKPLGKKLFLPYSLLRSGEDVLLDDVRVSDIESALNISIAASGRTGYDFTAAIFGLGEAYFEENGPAHDMGNPYELSETAD